MDGTCADQCETWRLCAHGRAVICRQRSGTAKGFVFVSLEDKTAIANAIITPALFEKIPTADFTGIFSRDRRCRAKSRRRGAHESASCGDAANAALTAPKSHDFR
jgi:error-prone DNA polymerase